MENMEFFIEGMLPEDIVHRVGLSLVVSSTDAKCMYLKANGKTIMGFKNGMYCKYTDAKNAIGNNGRTIEGLVLDKIGKIVQAENNF